MCMGIVRDSSILVYTGMWPIQIRRVKCDACLSGAFKSAGVKFCSSTLSTAHIGSASRASCGLVQDPSSWELSSVKVRTHISLEACAGIQTVKSLFGLARALDLDCATSTVHWIHANG
jgi:hypothetical protein